MLPSDLRGEEPLLIDAGVHSAIRAVIGPQQAEVGGMLGGSRADGVIRGFYFDRTAATSGSTYSPDAAEVNRLLRECWNPAGVNLLGFVHSHPAGFTRPSLGDRRYAAQILAAIPDLDRLALPIAQSIPDTGRFTLDGFVARRADGGARILPVEILRVPRSEELIEPFDGDPAYDRVREAYDLPRMATTRVIAVGAGGAASYLEDLARAGVGEFVLIDPDVVERPNLGTQQSYRRDLGRPKVEAIAERILDVNLHARVVIVQAFLDDLRDEDLARLVARPLRHGRIGVPSLSLLCAFTDSFAAQARVNRLSLHLGVPMIGAGVYREGRGLEVTFNVPGVTPACSRCALRRRYEAQSEKGDGRVVTSHGTPLYATTRLNALKELVSLAIILGTCDDNDHPAVIRHRSLLRRIADRNLVQVRLDPDIAASLGLSVFDRVASGPDGHRLVVDEAVWLKQEPESGSSGARCADCGGTGDLRDSIGKFADTRPMPCTFGDYRNG